MLTAHHAHHYLGFAANQWRLLEKEPSAKKLLYVLRVLLTGIRCMRTGIVEASLPELLEQDPPHELGPTPAVRELIERKVTGAEKLALSTNEVDTWRPVYDALVRRLETERNRSHLPNESNAHAALEDLAIRVRELGPDGV